MKTSNGRGVSKEHLEVEAGGLAAERPFPERRRALESVLEAVGGTPLIRLRRVAPPSGARLYAKVEYFNPGGSVKDRIGIRMIEAAEREGRLRPGGTIVEPTAGNTGVGLAIAAAVKGYRAIFVVPDKMSSEKISLLEAYGAEVVVVPTVAAGDPRSYYSVAERLAREIPGAFEPNQFANPANPAAHTESTGPEIWEQTESRVDVFVAGIGTGGTISGTARYLKERNPAITIVGADPEGSIYSGGYPGSYQVEGIGEDFLPRSFDSRLVDRVIRVPDRDSFLTARRLAREEGLLVGGSSGTAVFAALQVAAERGPEETVVVLCPDTGRNYLSKIFNDVWMIQNGFLPQPAVHIALGDLLAAKTHHSGRRALVAASPSWTVADAADRLTEAGMSQLPVLEEGEVVGTVNEGVIMQRLYRDPSVASRTVAEIMEPPLPVLDVSAGLDDVYLQLSGGAAGVLVAEHGTIAGIVTKADIVDVLADRARTLGSGAKGRK